MKLWIPFLTLILSGCTVGPQYQTPCSELPCAWETPKRLPSETVTSAETMMGWWEEITDPLLKSYQEQALSCNHDIQIAIATICQARGISQMASSHLYPHIQGKGSAERTRLSDALFQNAPLPSSGIQNLFSSLLDASWEIDLFGKNRHLSSAAHANIDKEVFRQEDITLTILAEVARNYFEIRGYQQLTRLAKDKITLLEQELQIEQTRYSTGITDLQKVEALEASYAKVKAQLPNLEGKVYTGIYALSVLTGNYPCALMDQMLKEAPLPPIPELIDIPLPSELLRRRPDIRAQERELAASTELIGYALASFYPSFSLKSFLGFETSSIKDLFKQSYKTWSVGGNLLLPLFEGGRLIGQLHTVEAKTTQTALAFQQTILNAIEEVERFLTLYEENRTKTTALHDNVQHLTKQIEIASLQYQKGLIDQMNSINQKLELLSADQGLIEARMTTLLHLVALYKALGGGWTCSEHSPSFFDGFEKGEEGVNAEEGS